MNKVILNGRLVADVETAEFGKGKNKNTYTNFVIAVRDGKDADGNDQAQFIRCTAFGKVAEIIEEFTSKGSAICVAGRLRNSSYEDEDGQTRYTTSVIVEDFDLIGSAKKEEKAKTGKNKKEEKAKTGKNKKYKR